MHLPWVFYPSKAAHSNCKENVGGIRDGLDATLLVSCIVILVGERPGFRFQEESKCPPALVVTWKSNKRHILYSPTCVDVNMSLVTNNELCFN